MAGYLDRTITRRTLVLLAPEYYRRLKPKPSFVAMPPAFSDDEGSDVGVDQSLAKKSSRARNPAKYEDEVPEDDDAASMDEKNGAPEGDDEEGDDDDEELDEEVYVVENIMSHMIDKSIGGRDKLYEDSANALKTKKRGRPSSSTPQASGKRSRRTRDHPADGEPPLSAKAAHMETTSRELGRTHRSS
ncbi:hypothetical protein CHGG_09231 [Chaetomium globosum CBS 148.51]|uniref:Uncharacterized protein n=1 Tax=Chaetomium globosum (strain ATCC 6205 / CBS 148.51 / DSM 1962 / NBRC 6347 / NRRL 1970) TaxID=306901 RepID=Q2GS23_CHAGB|nr:uncharacterized protein CHGG_09231 [Chaetomium globosum CBS 148.51]EAQ85217.1 hypothetical protein CHGG_09231 [Chaetomium globosum CBS 148.51]